MAWTVKLAIIGAVLVSGLAQAQAINESLIPPKPPGVIGAPAGAGKYPAVAEVRADYATHTFYHPATLPKQALPLIL
ncbi:MAG: hypothetical protein RL367_1920, partial [Pseudomonadota bacterium]